MVPSKTARTWELSILALDVVLKVYFEPIAKRRRIASKLHAMITSGFDCAEARSFYQDGRAGQVLIQEHDLHGDLNDFAYALLGGLHVDHEGSGGLYQIPIPHSSGVGGGFLRGYDYGVGGEYPDWDSKHQHGYGALVDLKLPTTGQIAFRSAHMAHRSP